ncbi:MAG: hypothetical protein HY902_06900, partial [Deltaproteobacteria bacterium]|nr:hypothetical protein [Deltaproteobacteria bacterium]
GDVAAVAPTVGTVTLSPTSGGACGVYTCIATGTSAAGKPLSFAWRWTRNGATLAVTTATVQGAPIAAGDSLQCFAKANDGQTGAGGALLWSSEVASNLATVVAKTTLTGTGMASAAEGIAAWNTDAGAPEAAKTGHVIPLVGPCITGNVYAYYYAASREYGGIDASSKGGFHLTGGDAGFPNFGKALAANGLGIGDVEWRYGPQTLGADVKGSDWSYTGTTETRIYAGGTWSLWVKGEKAVGGAMPVSTMTLAFGDVCNGDDDVMASTTDWTSAENQSSASSAATQAVAKAFLADIGTAKLRFGYSAGYPIVKQDIKANNRWGGFFDMTKATIEVGDCAP